jgi:hypothetical protein
MTDLDFRKLVRWRLCRVGRFIWRLPMLVGLGWTLTVHWTECPRCGVRLDGPDSLCGPCRAKHCKPPRHVAAEL